MSKKYKSLWSLVQESLPINELEGEKLWAIPSKLAENYGLREGQVIKLKCGSLSVQAEVITGDDDNLGLSSDILNHFKLPVKQKIGVKYEGKNKYRLGPVIGILTFRKVIAKKSFKRYLPYANKTKNIGLLYIFGPDSIDSKLKIIKGYHYNHSQNIWQEAEMPFPDVVMDRIYPNNFTAHAELGKNIGWKKIFNKNTLINKIDFSKVLSKDKFLKEHIPETKRFIDTSDFKYMMKKYPSVFLKPIDGMKGKGIIQVIKTDSGLVCRYMSEKKLKTRSINKYSEIFDVLKHVNAGKKKYIIQAAILRMEYNERAFGFRAMAVQNGSGKWSVPAIFTKITEPTGFLTNTSAGARIIFFKELLDGIENKLPYSKEHLLNLLTELSVKTASTLDKKLGPLGKLGIDIVVDASGKPWLIEANGNPGLMPRAAVREYPDWSFQMYDFPLAYCLKLSDFRHLKNTFPM